jgi:hypothetical protein
MTNTKYIETPTMNTTPRVYNINLLREIATLVNQGINVNVFERQYPGEFLYLQVEPPN